MDPNERKLLFKEEVFQIIARAIEVLNTLGHVGSGCKINTLG
jgi:hypothetical protein